MDEIIAIRMPAPVFLTLKWLHHSLRIKRQEISFVSRIVPTVQCSAPDLKEAHPLE